MKKKIEKSEDNERPIVSDILPNGNMVEMVYDEGERKTKLAVCDGSNIGYAEQIPISEKEVWVPCSARWSLIRKKVILFPSHAEEYGSDDELINEIQSFIHLYLYVIPIFEKIATHYVLLSWAFERFSEIPYLRALGDWGSGKSRIIQTIGSICFKPVFAGGATTVSPIFRIINQFHGTLILDEADFRFSDTTAEMIKILNSGYQKGIVVLRTEGDKVFETKAFDVFCPKIIATRERYFDLALESRFLVEETGIRSLRDDIPLNLPAKFWDEALALRNKLLMWRFKNFKGIEPKPVRDKGLEPRLNQIIAPLLCVINDDGLREEILTFMRSYNEQLLADRGMGVDADIARALISEYAKGDDPTVKEITNTYNEPYAKASERQELLTFRKVGSILRNKLHLQTDRKSKGVIVPWRLNRERIRVLKEKFGIGSEKKEQKDPMLLEQPYFGYELQTAAHIGEGVNEVNDDSEPAPEDKE
jgi:hypothetical protein